MKAVCHLQRMSRTRRNTHQLILLCYRDSVWNTFQSHLKPSFFTKPRRRNTCYTFIKKAKQRLYTEEYCCEVFLVCIAHIQSCVAYRGKFFNIHVIREGREKQWPLLSSDFVWDAKSQNRPSPRMKCTQCRNRKTRVLSPIQLPLPPIYIPYTLA